MEIYIYIFTRSQAVDVGSFTIAHDLELRQFHFGEDGNGLWAVHPFVPDLARRETDCNIRHNTKKSVYCATNQANGPTSWDSSRFSFVIIGQLAIKRNGEQLVSIISSRWNVYLQLSISTGQSWLSSGKYFRFIGHEAVMVILWHNTTGQLVIIHRQQTENRFGCEHSFRVHVPHTASDFTVVTDANEFVGRGHHMQIGRLFVGEKRVRHPHVAQVFGTDRQDFHATLPLEGESFVLPVLTKVDVQREILLGPNRI